MRLILKFLINTLFEKKACTFLVIFSIAAASGLIFANSGFKSTMTNMFYEADTRMAGNSDIVITAKNDESDIETIDMKSLSTLGDSTEYAYSFTQGDALYVPDIERMYTFRIYGVDIDDFMCHNPFPFSEGSTSDWSGNKIIVGKVYAELYGFHTGDSVTLEIGGVPVEFTVCAVAEPKGVYLVEEADGGIIFMPKDYLESVSELRTNLYAAPCQVDKNYGHLLCNIT